MTIITPFAQTFYVNASDTPDGVFLAAVDVCFSYKDDTLPISVMICPTVNGAPDATKVIINSEVIKYPSEIVTTTGAGTSLPNFGDPTTYTRFVFPALVYLIPGEYALVFKTNSGNYLIYIARLQDTVLGSTRLVSQQPYVGSLYKSQNTDTWDAYENEDLMFRLVRASFDTTLTGIIDYGNIKVPTANVNMDTFSIAVNDTILGKNKVSYAYKSTLGSTGVLDSANTAVIPNKNYQMPARGVITTAANGSFHIVTTFSTSSSYVSPILSPTRVNVTAIENLINDAPLINASISITIAGAGYNINALPAVTISAPTRSTGVQATGYANITAAKTIDQIILSNPGSGYIESATITIAHPPNDSGNANATAVITGETSKSGGNALARYMTRKVILSSGFDASDIQVNITACKQAGTDIQLYYKVQSKEDPDQNFDNKYWKRMNVATSVADVYSQNSLDFLEFKYTTPSSNATYYTANSTYKTFNTFAIKVCLFSSDPTVIPVLRDIRGLALA